MNVGTWNFWSVVLWTGVILSWAVWFDSPDIAVILETLFLAVLYAQWVDEPQLVKE